MIEVLLNVIPGETNLIYKFVSIVGFFKVVGKANNISQNSLHPNLDKISPSGVLSLLYLDKI